MRIDQRMEEIQGKLMKIMAEANNREEGIKLLEEYGLDKETATKLLKAFEYTESAKQAAKNVWESAYESKVGSEYSDEMAKSQETATDARMYFDLFNGQCALLIIARTLPPNQISPEVLGKLYERKIREEQINNSALRVSYHYYCESQQKSIDKEKLKEFMEKVRKNSISQKREIEKAEEKYNALKRDYINLQHEYSEIVEEHETYYQTALSLIKELQAKVNQLQRRGIFQVIGDKISGKNVIQRRRLPGNNPELPESLYKNNTERMGLYVRNEGEGKQNDRSKTSSELAKKVENDELQQ